MALTEYESGTQTATIGTEHFLGTDNDATDGVLQHVIDLAAMVRGDELEIRLYEKARAADTVRQIHMWKIKHNQTDDLWMSPWLAFLHNRRFSIKQTVGTGRAFPFSVRKQ